MNIPDRKYQILLGLFVMALVMANILGAKIFTIFGLPMPVTIFSYAFTYLATDVIGEIYGKKASNQVVRVGFICLLASILLVRIAVWIPSPFDSTSYDSVFSSTFRITIGSLVAYLCSQFLDVHIFHAIKEKNSGHKWIRNNVSTLASQLIDTSVFTLIAFYGTVPNIFKLIIGIYVAKAVIAVLDTPFFYLLTKNQGRKECV